MDEDKGLVIIVICAPLLVVGFTLAMILSDSQDITMVLLLLLAALFAIVGIIQLSGRGAWLVAGYNTMTEEEKAMYDPKVVARGCGVVMLGTAALIATSAFGIRYVVAGSIVFVIGLIIGILMIRKRDGNRLQ